MDKPREVTGKIQGHNAAKTEHHPWHRAHTDWPCLGLHGDRNGAYQRISTVLLAGCPGGVGPLLLPEATGTVPSSAKAGEGRPNYMCVCVCVCGSWSKSVLPSVII